MAAMTQDNQSLVAAGDVAPVGVQWSAADAASVRNRHHLTVIMATPATYEAKPSFISTITRRLTEGST